MAASKAAKMRFQVINGPGKGGLIGSSFFGERIEFTLTADEIISACSKAFLQEQSKKPALFCPGTVEGVKVKTRWIGIRAESGSGGQWIIDFTGPIRMSGEAKPRDRKFHGYYDSRSRTGFVDLTF